VSSVRSAVVLSAALVLSSVMGPPASATPRTASDLTRLAGASQATITTAAGRWLTPAAVKAVPTAHPQLSVYYCAQSPPCTGDSNTGYFVADTGWEDVPASIVSATVRGVGSLARLGGVVRYQLLDVRICLDAAAHLHNGAPATWISSMPASCSA
jgi:hypothetical protein